MNATHAAIVLLLGLLFFAYILRAVYRQELRTVHSLLWLGIGFILLCTPWLYSLFTWLHEEAGWPTPTSQIFLLGILLLLLLVFRLSITVSILWRRQRLLMRQMTLLEARLAAAPPLTAETTETASRLPASSHAPEDFSHAPQ